MEGEIVLGGENLRRQEMQEIYRFVGRDADEVFVFPHSLDPEQPLDLTMALLRLRLVSRQQVMAVHLVEPFGI